MGRKKTHDEFVAEMERKHPELDVIGAYKGNDKKVLIHCKICGNNFESRPNNLLSNHGCPHCTNIITHNNQRKTHEQFVSEIKKMHPKLVIESEYMGARKKLGVFCTVCGNHYYSKPNNLLRGRGCPQCGGTAKKTHEEFIELIHEINPNLIITSEYKNVASEVDVLCKVCGYEFSTRAHNLIYSKTGCPKCKMSHGEVKIQSFLDDNNIKYHIYHTFDDCKNILKLSFDFYLPKEKIAIEFDGIQHFKPVHYFGGEDSLIKQQCNDAIKTNYCNEHDIKLLRIPYTEYDNINEILNKEIIGVKI